MPAKPAISNIHVDHQGENLVALGWQTREARYHIWLTNNMTGDTTTLFKNPLIGRGDTMKPAPAEYFDTRRLDASKAHNLYMLACAMDAVKRGDMISKAKAKFEAEQAADEQARIRLTERRERAREIFLSIEARLALPNALSYALDRDDMDALLSYAPSNP